MPELPEVQTVVTDLNKKVVGRRITGVWFDWPRMMRTKAPTRIKRAPSVEEFEKSIKGSKIIAVKRRGKNILIYLHNPRFDQRESANLLLLIHQKMTGHMLLGRWNVKCQRPNVKCEVVPLEPKAIVADPQNRFIHLIFYLDNGEMLALSDLRKFAKVILGKTEDIENLPEVTNLGPDALDSKLTYEKFTELVRGEKRKIKQVLMDQEIIAGIGNIYSDDILWAAKIHPFKSASSLSVNELKSLWNAMRKILKIAVKLRGTSTSDFRDTSGEKGKYGNVLLVYQREGESCRRCKTKIKRVKMGGRSAHFCPSCQKLQ